MAIHSVNQHLLRVVCRFKSRNVAFVRHWHLQLLRTVCLYVIAPNTDARIILPSLRVFIWICSGIILILTLCGTHTLKHLQWIGLHKTFVEPYPAKHCAIGIKCHSSVHAEFFLIHPIRYSVYHLTHFTVFRNLTLGIVVEQLNKEDVIIAYKSHQRAIVRPHRRLLRTIIRQWLEFLALDCIYIICGTMRATIDALSVCLNKHAPSIGRHDISICTGYLCSDSITGIKKHCGLLSGFERILYNLLAIGTHLHILVATFQRIHTAHLFCIEITWGYRSERHTLIGIYGLHKQQTGNARND